MISVKRFQLLRTFSTSCALSKRDPWLDPNKMKPNEMMRETSPFQGNKVYTPDMSKTEEIKVNFKGLRFFNKRHLREHKKMLFQKFEKRDPKFSHIYEHKYGTRGTGIRHEDFWEYVPEMEPELIVPDLKDCQLKPYVSYKAQPLEKVSILFLSNCY